MHLCQSQEPVNANLKTQLKERIIEKQKCIWLHARVPPPTGPSLNRVKINQRRIKFIYRRLTCVTGEGSRGVPRPVRARGSGRGSLTGVQIRTRRKSPGRAPCLASRTLTDSTFNACHCFWLATSTRLWSWCRDAFACTSFHIYFAYARMHTSTHTNINIYTHNHI